MHKVKEMTLNSKTIKISDEAFTVLNEEASTRMKSHNGRIKFKDVASDLIILAFNDVKDSQKNNFEKLTIQHLKNLKSWGVNTNTDVIELISYIIYWDHIKLALSKGFSSTTAREHVYDYLTNSKNKQNIIGIIENYYTSFTG